MASCAAVMMKNIIDTEETNDRRVVNRGHGSASQLKRIMTDADGVGTTVLKAAGSGADECDVRAASDKAPRLPAADTSLASTFNGEIRAEFDNDPGN